MWVQSLTQEDPLEEGMATHSSVPAGGILWTEEPGGPQSMGSQSVGHDRAVEHTHRRSPHMAQIPETLTIPKRGGIWSFQKGTRLLLAIVHTEFGKDAMQPLRLPYILRLILRMHTVEEFLKLPLKCGIVDYVRYRGLCKVLRTDVTEDSPGGSVVKTSPSNARGVSSIPGRGAKIAHAFQPRN